MSRIPKLAFLVLLPLIPAFLGGCGEGESPAVTEPEERRVEASESGEDTPERASLFPGDPGKSGILGPDEVEQPAATFSSRSGRLTALPAALVAQGDSRALVNRDGHLAFYGADSSGEARWSREAVLPLLTLDEKRLVVATEGGVVAVGLQAGEELWRVALNETPRDLLSRDGMIFAAAGGSVARISAESGRVLARSSVAGEVRDLLLGETRLYVGTTSGVEAFDGEQELLWRYEAPGLSRLSLGPGGYLILESSGGLITLGGEEGSPLWELPGRVLPFRPLLLPGSLVLSREEGVLEAYDPSTGDLLWSRGVAAAFTGRPRFWQGRIWAPVSEGKLLAISTEGELIGSVKTERDEVAFLYGNGESLGVADHFGGYTELTPGGGQLELAVESSGVTPFALPALRVGAGPVLLELREAPVTLDVEEAAEGIYLFRLPLQERAETIIDLVGEDGSVVGSNLDKIELGDTLRIRLEAQERYTLELRPARADLAGKLTAVSLQLLREDR